MNFPCFHPKYAGGAALVLFQVQSILETLGAIPTLCDVQMMDSVTGKPCSS